ncbi:MAG: cytidylate kinase-like family protein [Verrucomicrobiae bacterium]|nr:cytidylate kinase-like family protein [Verrucomicrobiae bacterium]
MNTVASLEHALSYVETQIAPWKRHEHPRTPPTVTLSRMAGSGGIAVAEHLARFLQKHRPGNRAPWTVFHRSLVEKALAEHNLPATLVRYMPEDRVSYIRDTMEELLGLHPSSTTLDKQVAETTLGLAQLGNCILVGRGAHLILASLPTAFHLRLVGSPGKRAQRIADLRQLDLAAAHDYIQKEDAARRRHLKSHFDADIDDPLAYHLVLNTDTFSVEEAAEILGHAVLRRFPDSPAAA